MRKLILKTVISIDGYLEGPGGAMDWFQADEAEWREEFRLYADVDTVLLGRGMYAGYAKYWRDVLAGPAKHPKDEVAYARWAEATPHVVFSRDMPNADWANTKIMRDAAADVPRLKREAGKKLIVYGGARFAGALMELGLVDEYHLSVHPVLLGGGKLLFGTPTQRRALKLTAAKPLPSGAVWLSYKA